MNRLKPCLFALAFVILGTGSLCAQQGRGQRNSGEPVMQGQADPMDKLQFMVGTMWEFIGFHNTITGGRISDPVPYNTFALGVNYELLQSDDMYSLAAGGTAHFGLQFSNAGSSLILQTPVFLMGRVGAGATNFNNSKFGVGGGIGLNYTYLQLPLALVDGNGFLIGEGDIRKNMLSPMFMVEATLFQHYVLRFHMNLSRIDDTIRFDMVGQPPQDFEVEYSNWGIGLIYYIF